MPVIPDGKSLVKVLKKQYKNKILTPGKYGVGFKNLAQEKAYKKAYEAYLKKIKEQG